MVLLFTPVESKPLKFAVSDGDVLIAHLSISTEGHEVHPTPGRALRPDELAFISAYMSFHNRNRGLKAAKTRAEREQLRLLYALEDTRDAARLPDDFLERLYALDDPRSGHYREQA